MSYRSESDFSGALCNDLTQLGVFHQRFESAITGCGIPDLLMSGPVRDLWVELKNDSSMLHGGTIKVDWRRGQQAWALNYRRASGRCTYTLVAACSIFILIPMTKTFKGKLVSLGDYHVIRSLREVVDVLMKMII